MVDEKGSSRKPEPEESPTAGLWRASGMGVEFSAGIVGMIALGWLVDRGLNSAPWGMIVGAAMGIVGGGYNFFKQAQKMNRAATEAYRRDYSRRPTGTRSEPLSERGEREREDDARGR